MENIYQKELAELSSKSTRSSLVSRNVTIMGKRTSVRLEPEMWKALNNIADKEGCSVHDICTLVYICKNLATSLTAAIRVFLMLYFQAAANEQGHVSAGHGDFRNMIKRARISPDMQKFFKKSRHSVYERKRDKLISA